MEDQQAKIQAEMIMRLNGVKYLKEMNMVIFVLYNEYYFGDLFSYSTLIEESQNWNM